MSTLQQIAQQDPQWSLEEMVSCANDLLPQFLPHQPATMRVQEEVNPRLVRHYTTQGLVDKPIKVGREARYIYRHLLQLLIVRRLLSDGFNTTTIGQLTTSKSNPELEALLQGGMQLTVEAANPALSFLEQVQKRVERTAPPPLAAPTAKQLPVPAPPAGMAPLMPQPSMAKPLTASQWVRMEVLPGLELHMSAAFTAPASPQEQDNLLQLIAQTLAHLTAQRRPPP